METYLIYKAEFRNYKGEIINKCVVGTNLEEVTSEANELAEEREMELLSLTQIDTMDFDGKRFILK